MAENHRRMRYPEGAIHRLQERSKRLRRNTLCQEEKVILSSAEAVQRG